MSRVSLNVSGASSSSMVFVFAQKYVRLTFTTRIFGKTVNENVCLRPLCKVMSSVSLIACSRVL